MSQSTSNEAAAKPGGTPPVVVKKYANRRLYNTESSSYITLDTLADMVRSGRDFVVYDAKTGEDITRSVLTQIIVEEESKGRALLPTGFLRQLIGFYGDSLQNLVPRYLEQAMSSFARQQEQMRVTMQQTMGNLLPFGMEEVGRQNMAMMERAMSLFTPFYREPERPPQPGVNSANSVASQPAEDEINALRAEIASLRAELAQAKRAQAPLPRAEAEIGPAQENVAPTRKKVEF
jgi:polyhydroxyalkanoate synthesis repressor PhaR